MTPGKPSTLHYLDCHRAQASLSESWGRKAAWSLQSTVSCEDIFVRGVGHRKGWLWVRARHPQDMLSMCRADESPGKAPRRARTGLSPRPGSCWVEGQEQEVNVTRPGRALKAGRDCTGGSLCVLRT